MLKKLALVLLLFPVWAYADDLQKVYDDLNTALMSGRIKHPGFDQAYKVLTPLAEKGNIEAMYYISHLYHLGVGGAKRDAEKAKELIHTSAQNGFAVAQHQLGYHYERGVYGRINNAKAVEWYRKAADAGSCAAMKRLIKAYEYGELGLEKDTEKSATLKQQLSHCQ